MSSFPDVWMGGVGISEGKRQSVRRCLFGKPDHEKLHEALRSQEKIQELDDAGNKRFLERWGFDTVKDVPVDGGLFECSPVDLCKESVPEFYTKGYATRKSKPVSRIRDSWRGPYNQSLFGGDGQQAPSRKSVKRHLQFDDDQENKIISPLQLPSPLPRIQGVDTIVASSSSTSTLTLTVPAHHFSTLGLKSRKTQSSVEHPSVISRITDVSQSRRKRSRPSDTPSSFLDLATPQRSIDALRTPQRQTLIKEFYPLQKLRRSSHFDI